MDWRDDPYRVLSVEEQPTDPNDDYYTKPFKTKNGRRVYTCKAAYDKAMRNTIGHTAPRFGDPVMKAKCNSPEARAKAQATRQKKNAYRNAAKLIAQLPMTLRKDNELLVRIMHEFGVPNPTMADGVVLAQVLKAQAGDTAAATFVRDTAGEKPTNSLEVSALDKPIEEINLAELDDSQLEELAAGEGYLLDDRDPEPVATFTDVPDWVEDALDT